MKRLPFSNLLFMCILFPSYLSQLLSAADEDEMRSFHRSNERLYEHLFTKYNANLAPVYTKQHLNSTERPPLKTVYITLMYTKLVEVNAPKQIMTLIFEFQMTWRDERLYWNNSDFDDIDHMYVQRNKVWVPDICPLDSVEVYDSRPDYKQYALIAPGGYVTFFSATVTSTTCRIDVTAFPFDVQVCSVKLVSYSFDGTELTTGGMIYAPIAVNTVGNDEWEVLNISVSTEMLYGAILGVQLTSFDYVMQRNPLYYIALIVVPSFVQAFLCTAGIFSSIIYDVDVDKFSMGLTTIMSTAVMISIVADSIPKTKVTPLLSLLSFLVYCGQDINQTNSSNYVTQNLILVASANAIVIVLPRVSDFFHWVCRCKSSKSKAINYWIQATLNIFLLAIFEGLVVYNLISLLFRGIQSASKVDLLLQNRTWSTIGKGM